jgi:hypothetical protein
LIKHGRQQQTKAALSAPVLAVETSSAASSTDEPCQVRADLQQLSQHQCCSIFRKRKRGVKLIASRQGSSAAAWSPPALTAAKGMAASQQTLCQAMSGQLCSSFVST